MSHRIGQMVRISNGRYEKMLISGYLKMKIRDKSGRGLTSVVSLKIEFG